MTITGYCTNYTVMDTNPIFREAWGGHNTLSKTAHCRNTIDRMMKHNISHQLDHFPEKILHWKCSHGVFLKDWESSMFTAKDTMMNE